VLWGGLLQDGGPLRDSMTAVATEYPVRLASGEVDPTMGAAKLALAELADSAALPNRQSAGP